MKQTIYMICETQDAFTTFAGFVNMITFSAPKSPINVIQRQVRWYREHSSYGRKPVKVNAKMDLQEFIKFVYMTNYATHNTLYCQNGVFVLK